MAQAIRGIIATFSMLCDRYEIGPVRIATADIVMATVTYLELLGVTPPQDLEPHLLRFR